MKLSSEVTLFLVGLIATIGIVTSGYYYSMTEKQNANIDFLKKTLETRTEELNTANSTISTLGTELDNLKKDLEQIADDYRDEKNRNEEFEDQIRDLAGTLGDLDKLSKIDEELLAKYSKVYFLNENYIPSRIKEIRSRYILSGKGDQYFHANAIEHLEDMLDDAARDDIDLKVVSAYRSFETQSDLKGQYTQVYGSGANTFSADQGYSEHQLGTTVDLTDPTTAGTFTSFKDTEAYEWLLKNAYKYGFILSYPEDNNFYIFEPWHWRFVGTDLARYLYKNKKTFYEMEQRDINEYLINIFD